MNTPVATRRRSPLTCLASLGLAVACTAVGCAGYRAGSGSLYAPDVATVYVPMVDSDSTRRDLGERLTEALVKEIELKTPYKVVSSPNADSILEVRLRGDRRVVQAEDALDNPRVFENELRAESSWLNRRRLPIGPVNTFALPGALTGLPPSVDDTVGISQRSPLIPESGQTIASQQQQAIHRLAEQIVGTMEQPW